MCAVRVYLLNANHVTYTYVATIHEHIRRLFGRRDHLVHTYVYAYTHLNDHLHMNVSSLSNWRHGYTLRDMNMLPCVEF
jgi:hypothetical protein